MSKGLYPIRTIAAMTGVNPVTLRAWERRYGIIRPQRTPKGHRLYTERDIDRIRQVLVLLERGIPISQARQVLDEGEPGAQSGAAEPARAEPDDSVWSSFLARMRTSASVFDEHGLDDVLQEAHSLFPASRVRHHLIEPLYRQFAGSREPDARTAQDAFLSGWLSTVLGTRLRHRSPRTSGPRLLLASLGAAPDPVALLLLACEAVDRDYRVTLLLGDLPVQQLEAAARDSGAEAILLWSGQAAEEAVAAAPDSTEFPIFLAGPAARSPDGQTGPFIPVPGDSRDILTGVDTRYHAPGWATA
ncbi:MerR family transcriptional regulator [Aquisalimonas lutea]|uniref:MerR family transcriptional regulator n=1 Tax=Aquisalimonas lutea TaxID=1327750 RepID=UPI0025B5BBBE|nr:MerR family transcriptional regulator [Aquisalimonas lutea]MDN3516084.1 MerR family transcriptional regulator [Aquisalimonas lutea]